MHAKTWIHFKYITANERKPDLKFFLFYHFTYIMLSKRPNDRQKTTSCSQELEVAEGLCTKGREKLEGGVGYMIVYICHNSQNCLLKRMILLSINYTLIKK